MKEAFNRIRSSLSVSLTVWVAVFITMMFVIAVWLMLWFVRNTVEKESMEKAQATLETAVLNVDNILQRMETAVRNMQWNVEHHLDNPAMIDTYNRMLLESNDWIDGTSISLVPGFYAGADSLFLSYYQRWGGRIEKGFPLIDVPYTQQEWFARSLQSDSAGWSNPMFERLHAPHPITIFSIPLHQPGNEQGAPVGVMAGALSLDWLSRVIEATRPSPETYFSLLNREGSFIIHHDSTMLEPGSICRMQQLHPDSDMGRVYTAMCNGESGYMEGDIWGKQSCVFYRPFKNTGWSIDIVYPEKELFASYHSLLRLCIILTVVGVLALVLFCFLFIGLQLRGLYRIEVSSRQLINGHFNVPLKNNRRQDEIGQLQKAFSHMQDSISTHLETIAQQHEHLDEQGKALRAAYERTKEADKAKTLFMSSATDQLTQPVGVILALVEELQEKRSQLQKEEMNLMVDQMASKTKEVTTLLNQMIEVSTGKQKEQDYL